MNFKKFIKKVPSYWLSVIFLVNGPLLTAFLLRAGIRCGNGDLYYSDYEYVSLLTFIINKSNYQLLSLFEQYTLVVAPDIIKNSFWKMFPIKWRLIQTVTQLTKATTTGWRKPTRPSKKTFIPRSQPLKIGALFAPDW